MGRVSLICVVALLWPSLALADFQALLDQARLGDGAAVAARLAAGDDPNPPSYHSGYSPLQFAAGNGQAEMTRRLLAAGAETEYRDHNGDRALLWAAARGRAATVELLLAAGSPADSIDDPYGQTPLIRAAAGNHLEVVQALLRHGADVHRFDQTGDTALHGAAYAGNAEMVRLLLEAGANPNVMDGILYRTPLYNAARSGSAEAVQMLLEAGAARDMRSKDGESAVYIAALAGHAAAIEALWADGADIDLPRQDGETPLAAALRVADGEAAALALAAHTGRVDQGFAEALWRGNAKVALALFRRGAKPDGVTLEARSALAGAAQLEDPTLFELLLAQGPDLGTLGADALVAAASTGRLGVAETLLARGVEADAALPSGVTPLLAAARAGQVEMFRLLLARGADPGVLDKQGWGLRQHMAADVERGLAQLDRYSRSAAYHDTSELDAMLERLGKAHAEIEAILAGWER